MRITVTAMIVLLAVAAHANAQKGEVPIERIQKRIALGVDLVLACQQDDGSFCIIRERFKEYPSGSTGLALMTLQYARPHLKDKQRARALEAIRKGLAYVSQRRTEPRTYSAGFVICPLFMESPKRYRKIIDYCAKMLCLGQHGRDEGSLAGQWGYRLRLPSRGQGGVSGVLDRWGDKSNTQIALLGLYHASRAGFQVPRVIWKRARSHYRKVQFPNGGWGYREELRRTPYANMTIASTISLSLCNEMLLKKEGQCKAPPVDKHVQMGLKWIADNWESGKIGSDTYGLYALERLGIIMGRANIGGRDWYNDGARAYLNARRLKAFGTREVSECFGVMFLARGLEPIVINKLERRGTNDWNNTPYDVKRLVEHLQDRFQQRVQWRIVSLEAPKYLIHRTPILHISGHRKLDFNDEEKKKLKAYVDEGGTILAQACCSRKPFDKSFREFVKEVFGGELSPIPKTHRIYERMRVRNMAPKPKIEIFAFDNQQGRPGVIYLPHGHCRRWHLGGVGSRKALAVGTGIYFYVTTECKKMYERAHPGKTAPTGVAPPSPPRKVVEPAKKKRSLPAAPVGG